MLSAPQKCDDEVKAQAALPKKVKLERYTLEDEKLILYYNARLRKDGYGKRGSVQGSACPFTDADRWSGSGDDLCRWNATYG